MQQALIQQVALRRARAVLLELTRRVVLGRALVAQQERTPLLEHRLAYLVQQVSGREQRLPLAARVQQVKLRRLDPVHAPIALLVLIQPRQEARVVPRAQRALTHRPQVQHLVRVVRQVPSRRQLERLHVLHAQLALMLLQDRRLAAHVRRGHIQQQDPVCVPRVLQEHTVPVQAARRAPIVRLVNIQHRVHRRAQLALRELTLQLQARPLVVNVWQGRFLHQDRQVAQVVMLDHIQRLDLVLAPCALPAHTRAALAQLRAALAWLVLILPQERLVAHLVLLGRTVLLVLQVVLCVQQAVMVLRRHWLLALFVQRAVILHRLEVSHALHAQ